MTEAVDTEVDADVDYEPECECGNQGFCRVCREWMADHGYEDWS